MRSSLALVLVVGLALAALATAEAAPLTPYTKQAFMDAQNAGKPIVVYVHANW